MHGLRYLFDRLSGRDTVLDCAFGGRPFRLGVVAWREIRRVRELEHETALIERMQAHLRPGDTVYDVGANIGLISLLLALHPSGTASRVHCFEPEPRNVRQLDRNIELNGLAGRVQAHATALGEAAGAAELFVRGTAGEGRHSLAAEAGATGSIRVPVATMDAFARDGGDPPDVVKIDVEGAEGRVLAGMDGLLRDRRPRELFLEVHAKGDRDRMPDGRTLDGALAERGYTLAWRNPRRSGEHRHYRAPGAA